MLSPSAVFTSFYEKKKKIFSSKNRKKPKAKAFDVFLGKKFFSSVCPQNSTLLSLK
jgi:hypothetical protein